MTEPISPEEVGAMKLGSLPEYIFDAFNQLIIDNWNANSYRSSFKLKDVVAKLRANVKDFSCQEAYDKNWFDVEPYYREKGWEVEFDKPAYNENYDSCFLFTKGKSCK